MRLHNTEIDTTGMELSKTEGYVVPTREYEKANDQHVRNIVLFADANKALFQDAAGTKAAVAAEALRLFNMGALIIEDTAVKYVPTAGKMDGTTAKFTVGDATYTA
mgnify:CR=1 FL=1